MLEVLALAQTARDSGRPAEDLVIQEAGSTRKTVELGSELFDLVVATAQGRRTASEALGHQEFVLTYKSFEPIGPAYLPLRV
jgi:altronate dehydratase